MRVGDESSIKRTHDSWVLKVFSTIWVVLLAVGILSCKEPPPSCVKGGSELLATQAKGNQYYGGFLRIHSPSPVDCDIMLMPHSAQQTSFDKWSSVTVYSSRSCLKITKDSPVSILLYLGPQREESSSEYVEIPITSAFLNQLGDLRSQFMAGYQNQSSANSGAAKLEIYESMLAQLHRTRLINFQRSYREHGWIGKREKLSSSTKLLFQSLQADICSHGLLDQAIRPPLESDRYEKLLSYRVDATRNKKLGCYVFSDLVSFDATIQLSDSERQKLRTLWPSHTASYHVPVSLDSQGSQQLMSFDTLIRTRGVRDVSFLKTRVEQAYSVERLGSPTQDEYKLFTSLSSAWTKLDLDGAKRGGGMAKDMGNSFVRAMIGAQRYGSSLEQRFHDVIPHAQVMVAGNTASGSESLLRFHAQSMNRDQNGQPTFQSQTFIDRTLYGLLVGFEPQLKPMVQRHPVDRMYTGSFLLYGGHPIGTLLVVDRAHVPAPDSSGILLYNYELYRQDQNQPVPLAQIPSPSPKSSPPDDQDQRTEESGSPNPNPIESPGEKITPPTVKVTTSPTSPGSLSGQIPTISLSPESSSPQVTPISDLGTSRGSWYQESLQSCAAGEQVCDPEDSGCADDCTYCSSAHQDKPGCTPEELVGYVCELGSEGCSDTGVKCSVNPRESGCHSADACPSTSLFGGLLFGDTGCAAVMTPGTDEDLELSEYLCGS